MKNDWDSKFFGEFDCSFKRITLASSRWKSTYMRYLSNHNSILNETSIMVRSCCDKSFYTFWYTRQTQSWKPKTKMQSFFLFWYRNLRISSKASEERPSLFWYIFKSISSQHTCYLQIFRWSIQSYNHILNSKYTWLCPFIIIL